VAFVLDARTAFPDVEPWVFGSTDIPSAERRGRTARVASANWMASATLVAAHVS
jgi:uncharacterized hydantoinase/oxoprolinase family protein